MKALKTLSFFLTIAIIIAFSVETAAALSDADRLKNEVLRLHIRANSDSEEDQALKLEVRDRVLERASHIFNNVSSAEEALETARENEELLLDIIYGYLDEKGERLDVNIIFGEQWFPTRQYEDNIALPAGNYSAVTIELGEAEGENWWCVLYPPICLSASVDKRSITEEILSEPSQELSTRETAEAKVKFKIVEDINNFIDKIFN